MRILLGTLVLFAGTALAADATLDAARRCVQVKDSLERLVCFDRAFADSPAALGQVAAPAARSVPAAPVAAVPAVPVPSLGDESIKRSERERERAEAAAPTSLTARVTAVKETRKDVFRMTLDNGQVWQQMDLETLFSVAVGDTVQIEKGGMGGYRMARVTKGRSGGWVRVTRSR